MSRRNESSLAPQIINSNTNHDSSVNASVLTATKEVVLRAYIQNYTAEHESYKESHGFIQKNYTIQNLTNNTRATTSG